VEDRVVGQRSSSLREVLAWRAPIIKTNSSLSFVPFSNRKP
jgi:hypothetical protein